MNIWQQLGIEPTADIREIKKAYAVRLKQCRPDEKPAEFQKLHGAYKQALNQAKWRARRAIADHDQVTAAESIPLSAGDAAAVEHDGFPEHEETGSDLVVATDEPLPVAERAAGRASQKSLAGAAVDDAAIEEEVSGAPPPVSPETGELQHESYEAFCRRQMQLELEKLDALLGRREKHELESWGFLAHNPLMLDERFNYELGLAVLQRIGEHHLANNSSRKSYERLSGRVLSHLDRLFHWRDNEIYIRQRLEENICDRVFPYLEDNDEPLLPVASYVRGAKSVIPVTLAHDGPIKVYYFANGAQRLFAMIVDFTLAVFLMSGVFNLVDYLLATEYTRSLVDNHLVAMMVCVYVACALFFECSILQATPGKMLFGLKVTDASYRRLGYRHGVWRTIMFAVTSIGGYLTALINCFLSGRFLHDRLSRSYVIDYRRSKQMQKRRRG